MNQGNCKWRVPLDGGSPPEWGVSLWGDTHQVLITIIGIMTVTMTVIMTAIVNIVIMTVIVNIAIMKIRVTVEI